MDSLNILERITFDVDIFGLHRKFLSWFIKLIHHIKAHCLVHFSQLLYTWVLTPQDLMSMHFPVWRWCVVGPDKAGWKLVRIRLLHCLFRDWIPWSCFSKDILKVRVELRRYVSSQVRHFAIQELFVGGLGRKHSTLLPKGSYLPKGLKRMRGLAVEGACISIVAIKVVFDIGVADVIPLENFGVIYQLPEDSSWIFGWIISNLHHRLIILSKLRLLELAGNSTVVRVRNQAFVSSLSVAKHKGIFAELSIEVLGTWVIDVVSTVIFLLHAVSFLSYKSQSLFYFRCVGVDGLVLGSLGMHCQHYLLKVLYLLLPIKRVVWAVRGDILRGGYVYRFL